MMNNVADKFRVVLDDVSRGVAGSVGWESRHDANVGVGDRVGSVVFQYADDQLHEETRRE